MYDIVVYASKITIIIFLGNTNHGILIQNILVIVCANLTSNIVIFKKLSKGLQIYKCLLMDFFAMITDHTCVDR